MIRIQIQHFLILPFSDCRIHADGIFLILHLNPVSGRKAYFFQPFTFHADFGKKKQRNAIPCFFCLCRQDRLFIFMNQKERDLSWQIFSLIILRQRKRNSIPFTPILFFSISPMPSAVSSSFIRRTAFCDWHPMTPITSSTVKIMYARPRRSNHWLRMLRPRRSSIMPYSTFASQESAWKWLSVRVNRLRK